MLEDIWVMLALEWIEFHIGAGRKGEQEGENAHSRNYT